MNRQQTTRGTRYRREHAWVVERGGRGDWKILLTLYGRTLFKRRSRTQARALCAELNAYGLTGTAIRNMHRKYSR